MATSGISRVEVVTSVQRRRHFTDEEKLRFLEEVARPGSSTRTVAERHGLDRRLLYRWKSRFKALGLLTRGKSPRQRSLPAPVEIDDRVAPPAAAEPSFVRLASVREEAPESVRVHFAEGLVVEFPLTLTPERLAAVVRALRG